MTNVLQRIGDDCGNTFFFVFTVTVLFKSCFTFLFLSSSFFSSYVVWVFYQYCACFVMLATSPPDVFPPFRCADGSAEVQKCGQSVLVLDILLSVLFFLLLYLMYSDKHFHFSLYQTHICCMGILTLCFLYFSDV